MIKEFAERAVWYGSRARGMDPDRAAGRNTYADQTRDAGDTVRTPIDEDLNDEIPF